MIAWLPAVAVADEPVDFVSAVEQARFFVKKGWWDDADGALEAAVATDDGALDPEAWMLLATVRFQLCDVPGARYAADRAHSNSRDLDQAGQAAGLRDWLDAHFGTLTVSAPYRGVSTRLEIELVTPLFDPDLKLYLSRLKSRTDRAVALPHTLALPAGRYRINGVEVEVPAGGSATVLPRVRASALQASSVEIGFGPTFWVGRDLAALLPVPTTQLAWSVPAGRLVLGLEGAWTPQPWRTATDDLGFSAVSWRAGARVGAELGHLEPMVLRVSLGYGIGRIPGIALACRAQGDAYACGDAGDDADLYVHAPILAQMPKAEIAAIYLNRARSANLGAGFVASVEGAFGTPRSGEATASDATFRWTNESGGVAGLGIRGLATLTLAF